CCHVRLCRDTALPDLSTRSLHDALPICPDDPELVLGAHPGEDRDGPDLLLQGLVVDGLQLPARDDLRLLARIDQLQALGDGGRGDGMRSEEHTSELQSRENLVCRLLLEKKKTHVELKHK